MTRTMHAAQWDPAQNKVVVNTVPLPELGDGQLLIKIASASLCHSDLMSIAILGRTEPITLGHEGAGYVKEIHPSAKKKGFKVGDAVGFLYVQGGCYEFNGFTIPGFFAEYGVVDWQNCIVLPPEIDVQTASPMFCAGITSFHCIDSCELKSGDWIIIIGCGGLGQLAIQYAKAMGARVIAIDVNDDTLANSRSQGADFVFNSRADTKYKDSVLQLTNGGAQAVAVFSAADAAYETAIPLIEIGGILMVVGLPEKGIRLNALDIARGTYRVKGDSTSTPQRMPKAIDFTVRHGIKPQMEIHTTLDAVPDMVDRMRQGKSTKKMVICL